MDGAFSAETGESIHEVIISLLAITAKANCTTIINNHAFPVTYIGTYESKIWANIGMAEVVKFNVLGATY